MEDENYVAPDQNRYNTYKVEEPSVSAHSTFLESSTQEDGCIKENRDTSYFQFNKDDNLIHNDEEIIFLEFDRGKQADHENITEDLQLQPSIITTNQFPSNMEECNEPVLEIYQSQIDDHANDVVDKVAHDHNFAKTTIQKPRFKNSSNLMLISSHPSDKDPLGITNSEECNETKTTASLSSLNYVFNVVGNLSPSQDQGRIMMDSIMEMSSQELQDHHGPESENIHVEDNYDSEQECQVPNVCQEEIIPFQGNKEENLKSKESANAKINHKSQKNMVLKPKRMPENSLLDVVVPGGYTVKMQRYLYPQALCRVCLLAKSDMIFLFEDVNVMQNGLIENSKGPTAANRYNLIAAMKTLLDIEVEYGDGLPDHICNECLDNLMSFSVFRKQISLSQSTLTAVIEQVKDTKTPTMIPPLGSNDTSKLDIYRYADSVTTVQNMFKNSSFTHNVIRYLPDRIIDKMFSVFAFAVGLKSEKLSHLKKYATDPPYVNGWLCSICGITIRGSTETYIQHFSETHQIQPENVCFPCDLCDNAFVLVDSSGIQENYADHWIQHFFFYKCQICEKLLPGTKAIWVHKQSSHETSRSFKCPICQRVFYKRSHLTAHSKTHLSQEQRKQFLNMCKICGKGLSSSLKSHMTSVHNNNRSWKCEICGKEFKKKDVLMKHRVTVHKDDKGSSLSCPKCYEIYPPIEIEEHVKVCNTKVEGSHKLQCERCGKSFSRPGYLLEHMKIHSCELVGKKFE